MLTLYRQFIAFVSQPNHDYFYLHDGLGRSAKSKTRRLNAQLDLGVKIISNAPWIYKDELPRQFIAFFVSRSNHDYFNLHDGLGRSAKSKMRRVKCNHQLFALEV
jgi:hypothetical protein